MGGIAEAAEVSGCAVLGGDVSSSSELMVAVTVLGTVTDRPDGPEGHPVSRSGAAAGDVLALTGPCGGSAAALRELRAGARGPDAGLAYRRPVARLEEGEVARKCGAHAMIDVSDGLALDLHRLADASDVGFVLHEVPVAAGATLEEALGGGEDYELLIALAEADARRLTEELADSGQRVPLLIGKVLADAAARMMGDQELERLGWQHRLG
jgi:thiamine-monophosphate kinase